MRILPFQTAPPNEKIERRHNPPVANSRYGYRDYRPCLRWEFGFTCAFCLLHEGDLADLGAEGMGLTWIEHLTLASQDVQKVNEYNNCFYACRFCNHSRAKAPRVDESGRKLIDPCGQAWGERFSLSDDDRLLANEGDPDALYTSQAYDLNDARKVRRRRRRRERLTEWLSVLREGPRQVRSLVALSENVESLAQAAVILDAAATLRDCIFGAAVEILRYAAVPADSNASCDCGKEDHCRLPDWLAAQTQEIQPFGWLFSGHSSSQ